MKLRYSPTSPYVRKVLVCAIERNLEEGIERLATNTADPKSDLSSVNPLGKVPALILDGPARCTGMRRQALADGILDAAILRMIESGRRPQELRWPASIELQSGKMKRAVETLNKEAASFGNTVNLGTIAVGCALGYLDFRFAADDWRSGAPALASWYEGFAQRPAMQRTRPPEGA